MSTTQVTNGADKGASGATAVPMQLEVVVVPVADVDRAKSFYESLGWRLDADAGDDSHHVVQMTPPGSNASIIFGKRVTTAEPGSIDGLVVAVDNIEAARDELRSRGVDVEIFHDAAGGLGGGFDTLPEARAAGADPERRSYASYGSFRDPDGNGWLLQELTERLPGCVGPRDVSAFADLLHETAEHHDAFEKAAPPHDWWDWYAAYADARERGSTPEEAAAVAGR